MSAMSGSNLAELSLGSLQLGATSNRRNSSVVDVFPFKWCLHDAAILWKKNKKLYKKNCEIEMSVSECLVRPKEILYSANLLESKIHI